jgi:maltose-binding protein MalE
MSGMRRALAALLLGIAFEAGSAPSPAPLKLLVWINNDKGYTGLQKVGDAFAKASGVEVTVQHPEAVPDKFQQSAGAGKGPDRTLAKGSANRGAHSRAPSRACGSRTDRCRWH